jgi:hypothetical protein
MGTVYVEARPKGDPAGARIDDYAVEDHADHALATFRTQREGIECVSLCFRETGF